MTHDWRRRSSSSGPLGRHEVDHIGLVSKPLSDGGVIVGLSISKATAAVTSEGDDGTGALSSVESAATEGAVRVGGTGTSDKLSALATVKTGGAGTVRSSRND